MLKLSGAKVNGRGRPRSAPPVLLAGLPLDEDALDEDGIRERTNLMGVKAREPEIRVRDDHIARVEQISIDPGQGRHPIAEHRQAGAGGKEFIAGRAEEESFERKRAFDTGHGVDIFGRRFPGAEPALESSAPAAPELRVFAVRQPAPSVRRFVEPFFEHGYAGQKTHLITESINYRTAV